MDKHYLLRLPWPDKALSSNARVHWAKLATATGNARADAFLECKRHQVPYMTGADLEITYHPPDRRRRDAQNMPTALKASIDGIADAVRCDDSAFRVTFPRGFAEPVKGGCVLVHVRPRDA